MTIKTRDHVRRWAVVLAATTLASLSAIPPASAQTNRTAPVAVGDELASGTEAAEASAPVGAKQLTAGNSHTCAILDNDTVRCWGEGGNGQLGYGNTDTIGDDETPGSIAPVNLGTGRTAKQLTAGGDHTCAILDDDTVRCWGRGFYGQLGYANTDNIGDDETPGSVGPVNLGTGRTAKQLTAGNFHTCAILDNDTVRCWGLGGNGRLGYADMDNIGDDETPGSVGPVNLGTGRTAKQLTAGLFHTCAVLDDDTVRCWGFGGSGQLGYANTDTIGDNETPGSIAPVNLGTGRTAKQLTAGGTHTCAVLDDDTVRCWGEGANGALGYGNTDDIGDDETPGSIAPVNLGTGRTAKQLTAGGDHTCAVLDDDTVRCWGFGVIGQLGYGNTDTVGDDETPDTAGPVNLGTGRTAKQLTAGNLHTCAILDNDTVRCWGLGFSGQLGYGNTDFIGDNETPDTAGPVNLGAVCVNPFPVGDEAEYRAALLCADTAVSATTITVSADIVVDDGADPSYSGTEALVIDGAGHVLDATMSSRVLNSTSPATVTLRDITITGGTAAGDGGGVRASGPLTLQDATVWRNTAGEDGGGVHTDGDLSVTNSTVSQNSADGEGGGVSSGSTMSVDHATIAANSAEFGANVSGGVFGSLSRSVIANPVDGSNCTLAGVTTSDGDNYSDDTSCALTGDGDDQDPTNDALLGQARNNGPAPTPPEAGAIGSPRPTMYPLNGSPLIDAIESADCADSPAADQRGVTRPFGGGCDIGAIESVFPAHGFTDATPFFEPTIRWVTSTVNTPQILNGFPDNTFGQELNITRGQAARLYYRGAGSPDPLAQPPHGFSDVTPFYEDAVRWAKGVGLFNGYPDNTFRQNNPIARGEYIRSLYNFAGTQDVDAEGLDPHGLTDVTPFYEDAVRWAKAWGLANGFPDNTFRQTNNIKRGNAARTFYNTAQTPTAWADTMTAPDNMLFKDNLPDPPP